MLPAPSNLGLVGRNRGNLRDRRQDECAAWEADVRTRPVVFGQFVSPELFGSAGAAPLHPPDPLMVSLSNHEAREADVRTRPVVIG
jgi:hypothetical protein